MPEKQPYHVLQDNIEVKLRADRLGQLAPTIKVRELREIERGMINDTQELTSIFDNSTRESSHLLEGERIGEAAFDAAIYLDKSARPVRKIVHGLWKEFSHGDEPQAYFINIDKRPWLAEMGFVDGKDDTNLEDIPADLVSIDQIDSDSLRHTLTHIRALYTDSQSLLTIEEGNEEDMEKVWSLPTRLDGQTVAIVDEVKSSGNTLRIALQLMQAAIPGANFEGMWWSNPGQIAWDTGAENLQKATKYVPVWYDKDTADGRGVGDIDEAHSHRSPSKVQRLSSSVLSAPLFDPATGETSGVSKLTQRVNSDIQTLIHRYKTGELIDYLPDLDLADTNPELFEERVKQYYKVGSLAAALAIRRDNLKR